VIPWVVPLIWNTNAALSRLFVNPSAGAVKRSGASPKSNSGRFGYLPVAESFAVRGVAERLM
jgi:hypothetical protein